MESGGLEIYFKPYDRKHKTVFGKLRHKKTVTTKILRSSPLHIFDVIGMIHDTTGIGIFIIYSYVH
jgi:hypothetical protein